MRFRELLGPSPRNLGALGAVAALAFVATVLVPHWSTQYGAALTAFVLWMAWFVATFVRWLDDADF
ncbi:MAG: hypothetical protein ABEH77_09005 [Halobacteriaceae archaeon]